MQTPISPDTLTAAPGSASRLRADPLAAAGYITDVAHINQYYSHLAPVMMRKPAAPSSVMASSSSPVARNRRSRDRRGSFRGMPVTWTVVTPA